MYRGDCGQDRDEVITLQMTEVDEVEEPFSKARSGEHNAPQTQPNVVRGDPRPGMLVVKSAPSALDAMAQEHERDWARQHMEWAFVRKRAS